MNKLTKNLVCISMRNGVEIWIEKDRVSHLVDSIEKIKDNKFIVIGEEVVNTADIVGFFKADTMEESTRRKNGEWKCQHNNWHNKYESCFCGELKKYER